MWSMASGPSTGLQRDLVERNTPGHPTGSEETHHCQEERQLPLLQPNCVPPGPDVEEGSCGEAEMFIGLSLSIKAQSKEGWVPGTVCVSCHSAYVFTLLHVRELPHKRDTAVYVRLTVPPTFVPGKMFSSFPQMRRQQRPDTHCFHCYVIVS